MKSNLSKFLSALCLVFALVVVTAPYSTNAYADELKSQSVTDPNFTSPKAPQLDPEKEEYSPQIVPVVLGGIFITEELLKWLTVAAVASIVTMEGYSYIEDLYANAEKTRNKTEYKYYVAEYDKKNNWKIKTTKVMKKEEALAYVLKGTEYNVWTSNAIDARALAQAAGGGKQPTVAEKHDQNGNSNRLYYWHHHDAGRKAGHMFYGRYGFFGKAGNSPYSEGPSNQESEDENMEEAS